MYTYLIRRPLSIFNLIMSINTYCYAIQGHNSYTYNVHTAYKINIALLKFIALPNVAHLSADFKIFERFLFKKYMYM